VAERLAPLGQVEQARATNVRGVGSTRTSRLFVGLFPDDESPVFAHGTSNFRSIDTRQVAGLGSFRFRISTRGEG